MPPALISSQHWAQALHQLSFFKHPLGGSVTHGRFPIGDALAAAHLITPMGRISWISEWSNLCSYWAINSPCMPLAMAEHLVLLKVCNALHTLSHPDVYSVVSYASYRMTSADKCDWCVWGLTSSQPCTLHVVFNCMNISTVTASPLTCSARSQVFRHRVE